MNQFESEMLSVLKILSDSHTLENCIISGSWATYFYEKIFNGFIPRIKTTDLDVYLPEPKRIKPSDFCEKMRLNLFLKKEDVLTGKSSFVSGDFTVEFLTTPDRTLSNVIKVKGLSIGAEALPKMSLIGWNYVNVDYNGITVKVASPVSFVLQKLLINKERTPEAKKKKI